MSKSVLQKWMNKADVFGLSVLWVSKDADLSRDFTLVFLSNLLVNKDLKLLKSVILWPFFFNTIEVYFITLLTKTNRSRLAT